ncbi:MAG: hypothetical protein P8179_07010 [Candidatus Thiodiazotropha sp.]
MQLPCSCLHVPPQACHSRCSVIHPVGDHNHRSYFLQKWLLLRCPMNWQAGLASLKAASRVPAECQSDGNRIP